MAGNYLMEKKIPFKSALFVILILIFVIVAAGLLCGKSFHKVPGTVNGNIKLRTVKKMVRDNPEDVDAIAQLGYIYLTMKNYKQAVAWYEEAYQLAPKSSLVRQQLAVGYLALKKHEQAIELVESLAEEGIMNFKAHYILGKAYITAGNFEGAVVSFTKALVIRPSSADAHYLLGLSHEELGENEQAIKSYTRALEMVPDYKEAYLALDKISSERPNYGGKE